MTVRAVALAGELVEVTGVGYEPRGAFCLRGAEINPADRARLMELTGAAVLCNDARLRQTDAGWVIDGDPMEGALVSLGMKAGHDPALLRKQLPRIDEITGGLTLPDGACRSWRALYAGVARFPST